MILDGKHWAMDPVHIDAFLRSVHGLEQMPIPDMRDAMGEERRDYFRGISRWHQYEITESGVAVLDISGPMMSSVPAIYRHFGVSVCDMSEHEQMLYEIRDNDDVSAVVLRMDTPGGSVRGLQDLAAAVRAVQEAGKEVHAQGRGMVASAGVYLASQCNSISISEGCMYGSIGTYMVLMDTSRANEEQGVSLHLISSGGVKGKGADGVIDDETIAEYQRIVDTMNDNFINAVATGRGMDKDQAAALATGQLWTSSEAKSKGLIDEIENHPQAATPAQRKEKRMLTEVKALRDQFPGHADAIIDMAADGVSVDDIKANIQNIIAEDAERQRQEEVAALSQRAQELEAANAALSEELSAAKSKIQELSDIAALSASHEDVGNGGDVDDDCDGTVSAADVAAGKLTAEQSAALVRGELKVK